MPSFWSVPVGNGPYMRISKPGLRVGRTVALTAAAAGVATGGVACWQLAAKHVKIPKDFKMPRPVMEATCGAIGEIAQVAILYPLDTIKVRCQAGGVSATTVVRSMFAQGLTLRLFQQLYAGVLSTSLCSVAIGSLYYFSFCASKRMALNLPFLQQPSSTQQQQPAAAAAAATAAASSSSQGAASTQQAAPSTSHSLVADTQHEAHTAGQQQHHTSQALLGAIIAASATDMHGSAVLEASQQTDEGVSGDSRSAANVIAATSAALVGALIEAPVELFKHRAQAGQIDGSMMGAMVTALRTTGPGALYWGFFPFCLKSLPFDIGELWTYSTLRDVHDDMQKQQTPVGKVVQAVPPQIWDMAIGAAAGAAAVLISMPSDSIKTVMETSGVDMSKLGPVGSVRAFVAQGKSMVAARGLGGLFIGVAPRLAEQVPSTCFYWLAVEACRRALEPYTA